MKLRLLLTTVEVVVVAGSSGISLQQVGQRGSGERAGGRFSKQCLRSLGGTKLLAFWGPNESDERANAGNNTAYQKKKPEIELGAGIHTG